MAAMSENWDTRQSNILEIGCFSAFKEQNVHSIGKIGQIVANELALGVKHGYSKRVSIVHIQSPLVKDASFERSMKSEYGESIQFNLTTPFCNGNAEDLDSTPSLQFHLAVNGEILSNCPSEISEITQAQYHDTKKPLFPNGLRVNQILWNEITVGNNKYVLNVNYFCKLNKKDKVLNPEMLVKINGVVDEVLGRLQNSNTEGQSAQSKLALLSKQWNKIKNLVNKLDPKKFVNQLEPLDKKRIMMSLSAALFPVTIYVIKRLAFKHLPSTLQNWNKTSNMFLLATTVITPIATFLLLIKISHHSEKKRRINE